MAHHYDDSEYGSYGEEVIRAWLAWCLENGIGGWASNADREHDAVVWINANVERLGSCSPRATIKDAARRGFIGVNAAGDRYIIKLDRLAVTDGSTDNAFALGEDGLWCIRTGGPAEAAVSA